MALAEASSDSLATAMKKEQEEEDLNFPSGSNWGKLQLERLNFPLQPEIHTFSDLHWEHDLSSENQDILDQLRHGFGVHQDEWAKGSVDGVYRDFFDTLADMLPRLRAKQPTPRKPAIRSNTNLPSSSDHQLSSPWSVGGTNRPLPHFAGGSPSIEVSAKNRRNSDNDLAGYESDVEITHTSGPKRLREDFNKSPSLPPRTPTLNSSSPNVDFAATKNVRTTPPTPTPKRLREDFTKSPSLPGRAHGPISDSTAVAFLDTEFPSSQTDSTLQFSGPSGSVSDDEGLDGDRPEVDVTMLIHSLLKQICDTHGNSN